MPTTAIRVLITGFEPFDGERENSSWAVAQALQGASLELPKGGAGVGYPGARRATVIAARLPCRFEASRKTLVRLIKKHEPHCVIALGQAGNRVDITVERVAINVNDARIADNGGAQPIDTAVFEDGPVGYFSGLPIKAIVAAMRRSGVPASVSQTAGTFVCNHVFYALMHHRAQERPDLRAGFIHLPPLPSQVAVRPGSPSMATQTMVEAIRVAAITALVTRKDRRIALGATS